LNNSPLPVVAIVATVLFCAVQVMGPMVEVMSFPLFVAITW
jgi:hypothetical protein